MDGAESQQDLHPAKATKLASMRVFPGIESRSTAMGKENAATKAAASPCVKPLRN
jgi:hypothetical protein